MADEIREYIRAAQAAEIRGDLPQAIEFLKKAAAMYRSAGNLTRALQMLRHASRLDGGNGELQAEVRRLEWIPDVSLSESMKVAEEETKRALEPLDALSEPPPPALPGEDRPLVERGPTRAAEGVNAWCSFCCRPRTEVGNLVAGPAGAFICATCLAEARRLLGTAPLRGSAEPLAVRGLPGIAETHGEGASGAAPQSGRLPGTTEGEDALLVPAVGAPITVPDAAPIVPLLTGSPGRKGAPAARPATQGWPLLDGWAADAPAPSIELAGLDDAVRALEVAFEAGRKRILLLGPTGSGKSALLRALERRGFGTVVSDPVSLSAAPAMGRLLLDGLDALTPDRVGALLRAAAQQGHPVVFALRGAAPASLLTLRDDATALPLHPSAALVTASAEHLSATDAELVDAVVPLRAPTAEELLELARRLAALRASELDLADDVLAALAQEAARAPRGGHELRALIARIPPGTWSLGATAAPESGARRKKGRGRGGA